MKQIGVAVVGLGENGLDTVKAAMKSEYVNQAVGVDLKQEACDKCLQRFEIPVTTKIDDVLTNQDIVLIYICTPNSYHYPIGKVALLHGKKVCMEKPMGLNLGETEDLVKIVRKNNGYLHVGFELRYYSKLYVRMKEILDSGEIGKLKHINCQYIISPFGNETEHKRWRYKLETSGGLFQEKLCHYIDLPRWWDGTKVTQFFITKADNVIPYYEIADNFELSYKFESGVVSHLTFMMNAAGAGSNDLIYTTELEIQKKEGYRLYYQLVGTEGAIEGNVFHRELRVFYHPGKKGMGGKSKMVRVESWKPEEDHLYFHNTTDEKMDTARRAVLNMPPPIEPEDAAETMRLCYEFEAAASQDWKIVRR